MSYTVVMKIAEGNVCHTRECLGCEEVLVLFCPEIFIKSLEEPVYIHVVGWWGQTVSSSWRDEFLFLMNLDV